MFSVIIGFAFLIGALLIGRVPFIHERNFVKLIARILLVATGLFSLLSTSFVRIAPDHVGVVRKIYGFKSLPQGHLIATDGETGYQAEIIPPGAFKFSFLFNVYNDVVEVPVVKIPQGFYGRVVTADGENLQEGDIMASAWQKDRQKDFLDAEKFLRNGGKRGLQATILLPGTYPVNLALYNVRVGYTPNGKDVKTSIDEVYDINGIHQETTPLTTEITKIPSGFVGVVRSTINEGNNDCHEKASKTVSNGLVATLVPRGCKGIWDVSLSPGDYYLNRDAYDVTLVDTRVQTLEFKGGYERRYIDLTVNQKGGFEQQERHEKILSDSNYADQAVFTKVEGWEVPQELRVVLQVQPEHAPIVVAAVGGLSEVEKRIIVPAIRSNVRNVFGGSINVLEDGKIVNRPTHILDLVEKRPILEEAILKFVIDDAGKDGIDVKEIRLGDSVIPPELLLARQRQQLATQLKLAFEQEQVAQVQRQSTEQARATADNQAQLVQAQISVQKAELLEKQRGAEGRAEKAFLEGQAAGQAEQVKVIGQENVVRLRMATLISDMLANHPELLSNLKLPNTLVIGSAGLEGGAGVLASALQEGVSQGLPMSLKK